ncbi:serine/threonine protein phosphatase 1 [Sphingomonas guangdongensis]|uniref:Serine/threonine protein phosphatase 1 n=1 Tax=Sphingomonas guangdongensis TaxID=1141890 RepID=A0A285QHT9_9SPHN|nr:metallophosphoesterase family protein [Sphingomonas guangdongensis]SOB81078.1 serine/threonine protein phosphatase 1 [Sphingomonas guangdongensis]
MIRRLLNRGVPRVPSGHRIYAIGDIHGRFDLLADLITKIADEQSALLPMRTHIVFLGDLIDRGPDSQQVIQLVRWNERNKARIIALKGNHEEIMVDAWRGNAEALTGWLAYGGIDTLVSFGAERDAIDPDRTEDMLALVRRTVPKDLIDWVDRLPLIWQCGDYAFVHAGIRPGLPLDRQEAADLLWIRNEFLDFADRHERVIVHGHTVTKNVEIRVNRIGIDTGAYASGRLSALCLCGSEQRVICTGRPVLPGEVRA